MHINPDFAAPELPPLFYPGHGGFPVSKLIFQPEVLTQQYEIKPPTMFVYDLQQSTPPITVEGGREAAYQRLVNQVQSYSQLQIGWDGYQGKPAKIRSQSDALLFLAVVSKTFPIPRAMLSSDGEISLYWESERNYAEIDFPGDGTYYYFCETPDFYAEEDGLPSRPNPTVPAALAGFLRGKFA